MVKLKGTSKIFPYEDDHELQIFAPFADTLSPEVRAVDIDNYELITGISKDPSEGGYYVSPPFSLRDRPVTR
jgi:hypothetical protein